MRFAPWLATATGATRLSRRVDAASSAFAVDGTSTTRPGLSGRILIPFGMTTNCASCGARSTTFCSRLKYESAPGPPMLQLRRAVRRQLEQLGDAPARQAIARRPDREHDRLRQCRARLRECGREHRPGHLRLVDLRRQRNPVAAVHRGQRGDDRCPGSVAIEHAARVCRRDHRTQPVAHDCRLVVRLVDGLCDPVERGAQLRLVVGRARSDVRAAEQAQPHAAKPAQRAETVTVTARCCDRTLPVRAQPEVACAQLEGRAPRP